MKKFYICKETATLNLKQQARAEKEMRKKIAEWDGGDILNVVFDGEIQNRIDWDPEELGVYSTLEEAQEAANSKNIESSAWVYGSNLELVAYYIEERDYFEGEDGYYESCGMYDIPRESYVQEAQRVQGGEKMRHWFAVVRENDAYDDWGYGSYDPHEAMKMAYEVTKEWEDWGDNYIVAAIDEDAKFCDFEISFDDIVEFVEHGTYSVETYQRLSGEDGE